MNQWVIFKNAFFLFCHWPVALSFLSSTNGVNKPFGKCAHCVAPSRGRQTHCVSDLFSWPKLHSDKFFICSNGPCRDLQQQNYNTHCIDHRVCLKNSTISPLIPDCGKCLWSAIGKGHHSVSTPRNRQRRFGCPRRDRRMFLCRRNGWEKKNIIRLLDRFCSADSLEMGTNLFSQIPQWMAFVSVRSAVDFSQYNGQCLWRFSVYRRAAFSCLVLQSKSDEMRVKIYCELCFVAMRCDAK